MSQTSLSEQFSDRTRCKSRRHMIITPEPCLIFTIQILYWPVAGACICRREAFFICWFDMEEHTPAQSTTRSDDLLFGFFETHYCAPCARLVGLGVQDPT